jgi:hypothetical protein
MLNHVKISMEKACSKSGDYQQLVTLDEPTTIQIPATQNSTRLNALEVKSGTVPPDKTINFTR